MLDLQQAAGNRAVVQLIAAGRAAPPPFVQRAPGGAGWLGTDEDDEPRKVDPGALVLKPDDNGKPAVEMSWTVLQAAIDENDSIVKSAIQATPDIVRREKRLTELYAAQQKLGTQAAGGPAPAKAPAGGRRAKKQARPEMPPKPISLSGSRDWSKEPAPIVKRELDMVVAYLAAHPKKAEREILLLELPNIEKAAGAARDERNTERRSEQFAEALSSKTGSEGQKLDELLHRLQFAEKDPSQDDIWLIHYDDHVMPLSSAELAAVRKKVGEGLVVASRKVSGLVYDVEGAWEERTTHNRGHSRTHTLVKWATGADDIPRSDMDNMTGTSRMYSKRITQKVAAGDLVGAGDDVQAADQNARYWAEKVGNWESELMRGAGRWVLGLTILKEALSIMAGFGAARLATLAGAGSTLATFKAGLQIATMTTATGLVAGGLGAAATDGDIKKGMRAGGGAGFGVGSSALTAGISTIASVGNARNIASVGGKAWEMTKAVGLETGANVATSSAQALIEGGSVKDAALGAAVSTPISTLGGGAVDAIAKSKAAATVGKTVVGIVSGTAGAAATDQDLVHGGLSGGGGALYGGLATPFPATPTGSGDGTPPPGSEAPALPGAPALSPGLLGAGNGPGPLPAPGTSAGTVGSGLPTLVPAAPAPAGAPTTGAPAPATGTVAGANAPAGASAPAGGAGADVLPTHQDLDVAFGNLESGTGPKGEASNLYSVHPDALTDARFSRTGGSELDLRNISKVGVTEGTAPLQPGDKAAATVPGKRPPETWLLEQDRAGITDPAEAARTDFKPKRTPDDLGFESRNAQIVAGPQGEAVRTPTGPTFGTDQVVGGARGATLDPATGTWQPAGAPHVRTPNPLGQDAQFAPRTPDEWHAWEQTHGPLTDEQRYALWFYSDDLSGQINPALRGQRAKQFVSDPIARESAAGDLDRTMQPVPFDTVVHRKASVDDFNDLGVTDPAELVNLKGQSYAHQGYTSTAVVSGKWSGEIDIVIEVPKGTRGRYLAGAPGAEPTNPVKPTPGAPLASMPGEMEFLLERGTSFTIQDARQDPSTGRWTVEVRVAEQGEKAQPLSNPMPLPGTPSKP